MITEQEIGIAERFFETLDADSSRTFFEKFSETQPFIFIYVMAMSENLKSEEAKYDTLYLTGVVYKAFETHYNLVKEISEAEIDSTEKEIIEKYEGLSQGSDDELSAGAKSLINETPQPSVLAYIGTAIASAGEEYNDEDQGLAFNILQTVVECIHKSVSNGTSMNIVK